MLIIPAIDLIDGRTVRLTQGDYGRQTDYDVEPEEAARRFEAGGAGWLHVVDLDGARAGRPVNLNTLERICRATGLNVEYGGGLRAEADVQAAINAGAARVILGSVLVRDPEFARLAFARYGEQVVAGIDTRDGQVAVAGWRESSAASGVELARELTSQGARRIIWTDIARDGELIGPNLSGLAGMLNAVDVPLIASGGVAGLDDIGAIARLSSPDGRRIEGAIVGKALYEGRFTMAEALSATRFVVS